MLPQPTDSPDVPPAAGLLPALTIALPGDRNRDHGTEPDDAAAEDEATPEASEDDNAIEDHAGPEKDGEAEDDAGPDPDDPEDFVPVIKDQDGGDDLSSWDDGDLSWTSADSTDRDDEPDAADWGDLSWPGQTPEPGPADPTHVATRPHLAAWRPRRADPATAVVDDEPERPQVLQVSSRRMTEEERAAYWAEREAAARAQRDAEREAEEPADDADDEKPAERRALDLLEQDRGAWVSGAEQPGVIG